MLQYGYGMLRQARKLVKLHHEYSMYDAQWLEDGRVITFARSARVWDVSAPSAPFSMNQGNTYFECNVER